jgi:predicted nucleic-acid-binding Zn-ribbon protein
MLTKADFPNSFNGDFRPALTRCRCPKCRSGNLLLTELVTAVTEWEVVEGRLNRAEGVHEPTGAEGVDGKCNDCGHRWRIKKAIQITCVTTELDPDTFDPI